eukprot:1983121-Heterocapsa_arctica.AAC.1
MPNLGPVADIYVPFRPSVAIDVANRVQAQAVERIRTQRPGKTSIARCMSTLLTAAGKTSIERGQRYECMAYYNSREQKYRCIGLSVYPCIRVPVYPCIGVSVYRCIGVSVYPCI